MFTKKKKKSFQIPSVYTIIIAIMIIIVFVTWIPGVVHPFDIVKDGKTERVTPHKLGILDVFHATILGIKDRADVIAFVLAIGAYVALILKSGALEAGIGVLIKKLNGKEIWIIPICIIFFSLGGTIYNMAEETIAYYPILIPVLMFAGFDTITVIMVVTFGAGMGVIGSTIAPFSIIIASSTLEISPMNGIIWRIIIYLVTLSATIGITMWYANRVRKDPSKSTLSHAKLAEHKEEFGHIQELPEFTLRRKFICAVFGITFILMVLIELPWYRFFGIDNDTWEGKNNNPGLVASFLIKEFPYLLTSIFSAVDGGIFIDLATLFLVMSLVVGALNWHGEKEQINSMVSGAGELLGVALIISTAGGVGILLDNNHSGLSYIIAKGLGDSVGSMPGPAFVLVCYFIFIIISFFIPSTSGFAIAILPLFKEAAMRSGSMSGMITAYVNAEGFMNLITPAGLPMACLMIAKVDYRDFWKGCWPLILAAFLIPLVFLPMGSALGQWLYPGHPEGTIFF